MGNVGGGIVVQTVDTEANAAGCGRLPHPEIEGIPSEGLFLGKNAPFDLPQAMKRMLHYVQCSKHTVFTRSTYLKVGHWRPNFCAHTQTNVGNNFFLSAREGKPPICLSELRRVQREKKPEVSGAS